MAAATAATQSEESGICWINDGGGEHGGVKFQTRRNNRHGTNNGKAEVPTKAHGGHKKGLQMRSGPSGTEGKAWSQPTTTAVDMEERILSSASSNCNPTSQGTSDLTKAKSLVSLKDLCPEDKRRIANLIQELARVSEEKDESVQRLRSEQETFERKIQNLEEQNLLIVEERESLQQQYRECQELLVLYQQYLSQQQQTLNQSIAQQLSQPPGHSKVPSSEEEEEGPSRPPPPTSRTNGSALDGSYLGIAATQTGRPRQAGGRGHHHHHHASLSTETTPPVDSSSFSSSSTSPSGSQGSVTPLRRQRGGRRGGGAWSEQPFSPAPCHCGPKRCCCGHRHRTADTQPPRKGQRDHRHHRCPDPELQCDRLSGGGEGAVAVVPGDDGVSALTTPLLGHQGWEEKRHQLLLQKMQLEVERERLQARLAQQEARLIAQNQQLRESRLHYHRFQQATQGELGSSTNRTAVSQPEDPSGCHVLSRQCEEAQADACPASAEPPARAATVCSHEDLCGSKADMDTSPVVPTANSVKTTSVCVMPRTPESRLDSSLIELLEVFSPISLPVHRQPSGTSRQQAAVPRSACSSSRTPASGHRQSHRGAPLSPTPARCYPPQSPHQDLEESHMLEDIFFIC